MDEAFGGHFVALSELIETESMGFVGGRFFNAAVLYRTYHSRIIDIDILFYGNERVDNEKLIIPHKDIGNRPFVMMPLKEIAEPSLKEAFPEYFE